MDLSFFKNRCISVHRSDDLFIMYFRKWPMIPLFWQNFHHFSAKHWGLRRVLKSYYNVRARARFRVLSAIRSPRPLARRPPKEKFWKLVQSSVDSRRVRTMEADPGDLQDDLVQDQNDQNDQIDQDCLWCCKQNCQDKCPKCGLVWYCSEKHLKNHYDQAEKCLPWRIRHSSTKGRYTMAVRDIQPTELIMRDLPLVVGPSR